MAAAQAIAQRICVYDGAGAVPLQAVAEGAEPAPLLDALTSADSGADSLGGTVTHPAAAPVAFPRRVAEYDDDFDLFARAAEGGAWAAASSRSSMLSSACNSLSEELTM